MVNNATASIQQQIICVMVICNLIHAQKKNRCCFAVLKSILPTDSHRVESKVNVANKNVQKIYCNAANWNAAMILFGLLQCWKRKKWEWNCNTFSTHWRATTQQMQLSDAIESYLTKRYIEPFGRPLQTKRNRIKSFACQLKIMKIFMKPLENSTEVLVVEWVPKRCKVEEKTFKHFDL